MLSSARDVASLQHTRHGVRYPATNPLTTKALEREERPDCPSKKPLLVQS